MSRSDSTAIYAPAPPPESFNAPEGFAAPSGLSTVIVDSIAGDTVPGRIPHFIPAEQADSLRAQALADSLFSVKEIPAPSGRDEGLEPAALPPDGGSGILSAIMVGILLLAAVNASGIARALKSYKAELWSVRRRNAFDDETTVREPIAILLVFIFIIFGGITLYDIPCRPAFPSLGGVLASMGLAGSYYLFQICAYSLIGYAFADEEQNKSWLGGFYATQAFAALGMAIPATIAVTSPAWATAAAYTAAGIYALAHLMFIIKGFRIFYHKISSLLYFILYLCTLEIIPVLALYRISLYLTEAFR